MARAFDIAPATKSAPLDGSGKGELSFTVSNALKRDVRARAAVVPEGGTKAEWVKLDAAEKDLKADGTATFTARIAVPQGTSPAEYMFHLIVSTVANPDEEFADGPAVSFRVAKAEAPPPPRPFPWWIVALVAAVLLVGGGVAYLLIPPKGKLGDPCTDGKCAGRLVCIERAGKSACWLPVGKNCAAGDDCATGRCTGGKCIAVPVRTRCAGQGDCDATEVCTPLADHQFCLYRKAQSCTGELDCASGWCREDKTCSDEHGACAGDKDCPPGGAFACKDRLCRRTDGNACKSSNECVSGFCNVTSCAPPPPPQQSPCTPPCGAGQICEPLLVHGVGGPSSMHPLRWFCMPAIRLDDVVREKRIWNLRKNVEPLP